MLRSALPASTARRILPCSYHLIQGSVNSGLRSLDIQHILVEEYNRLDVHSRALPPKSPGSKQGRNPSFLPCL
jgi:hypothetical protein